MNRLKLVLNVVFAPYLDLSGMVVLCLAQWVARLALNINYCGSHCYEACFLLSAGLISFLHCLEIADIKTTTMFKALVNLISEEGFMDCICRNSGTNIVNMKYPLHKYAIAKAGINLNWLNEAIYNPVAGNMAELSMIKFAIE